MSLLSGKYLAAVFGAYIGIFSIYVLLPSLGGWIWLPALLITALFGFRLFFSEKSRMFSLRKALILCMMAAAVLLAAFRAGGFCETESLAKALADGEVHIANGKIEEILYEEPYGSAYTVRLTDADGKETDFGVTLTLPFAGGFSPCDLVRFEGVFTEIEDEYVLYRKAKGVYLDADAQTAKKTGEAEKNALSVFETWRGSICGILRTYLSEDTAGYAEALLVGERSSLDASLRLAYMRLGISHLLAVSGLHLSVIVGGADMLLRIFTVPKKKKNFVLILLTAGFALIAGLSASIVRAALMLSLYYLSDMLGERHDSVTALLFAAFVILFVRAEAVYDIGFWLSVLSTLGILAVIPALSAVPRGKSVFGKIAFSLLSCAAMTLGATFFTMPVTYLVFGGVSLVSPLANLFFVPLTQIILYLLILLVVLAWVPFLAPLFGSIADILISVSNEIAFAASDMRGIYISIRYPFAKYILAALVVGILTVVFLKSLRPAWIFAVFFGCVIAFGGAFFVYARMGEDKTAVYLQTDGKSDVIGIVSGGETMVIDISTGGSTVPDAAVESLSDFYEYEIDTFVLTHYHAYHANTLRGLSESVKIHRLLLPTTENETDEKYLSEIFSAVAGRFEIAFYKRTGELSASVGDVSLGLPSYTLLGRSTHPVVAFYAEIADGQTFSYMGASAFERDILSADVVFCGVNGPVTKNIFEAKSLASAKLVVFSSTETAFYTETERMKTVAFAKDYGGYVKILFE